jgi:hypothetical protein
LTLNGLPNKSTRFISAAKAELDSRQLNHTKIKPTQEKQ